MFKCNTQTHTKPNNILLDYILIYVFIHLFQSIFLKGLKQLERTLFESNKKLAQHNVMMTTKRDRFMASISISF